MLKLLRSTSLYDVSNNKTYLFIPLEGDPARFGASAAQPVNRLVLEQRGVTKVLVDGVCGHLGNVLSSLGLDVKRDERVCHEVMDGLEPLLPDKVLPIVEQSVVESLVPKPGLRCTDEDAVRAKAGEGEAGS